MKFLFPKSFEEKEMFKIKVIIIQIATRRKKCWKCDILAQNLRENWKKKTSKSKWNIKMSPYILKIKKKRVKCSNEWCPFINEGMLNMYMTTFVGKIFIYKIRFTRIDDWIDFVKLLIIVKFLNSCTVIPMDKGEGGGHQTTV